MRHRRPTELLPELHVHALHVVPDPVRAVEIKFWASCPYIHASQIKFRASCPYTYIARLAWLSVQEQQACFKAACPFAAQRLACSRSAGSWAAELKLRGVGFVRS